jgi:phage terminase large subunit-like protein
MPIKYAEIVDDHVREQLAVWMDNIEAAEKEKRFNRIFAYKPYPNQLKFHMLGSTYLDRCFMASNRTGKTESGAAEMTFHLTGFYPAGWKGFRFKRPIRAWASGVTSELTRDVSQVKLFGPANDEEALGTGFVPRACIVSKTLAHGATGAFDTVVVKHCTDGFYDGNSSILFKSYNQGTSKFQGDTIDCAWADEEPPGEMIAAQGLLAEFKTRLMGVGLFWMTYTPILGRTPVTETYLREPGPHQIVIHQSLDDIDLRHLNVLDENGVPFPIGSDGDTIRARIKKDWPEWQRENRAAGLPVQGGGAVFPYAVSSILEDPIDYIPDHWTKIWGVDFGIDHPFAAVLTAWDRDADVFHVIATFRQKGSLPLNHAYAIKQICSNMPVAWPQDGYQKDKGSGYELRKQYAAHDLIMRPTHAKWESGDRDTEAGLMEMSQRMTTGRFKVARHLQEWQVEFMNYRRKDGKLVKENDDLLSATRIAIMDKRFGHVGPILAGPAKKLKRRTTSREQDWDPFMT